MLLKAKVGTQGVQKAAKERFFPQCKINRENKVFIQAETMTTGLSDMRIYF